MGLFLELFNKKLDNFSNSLFNRKILDCRCNGALR